MNTKAVSYWGDMFKCFVTAFQMPHKISIIEVRGIDKQKHMFWLNCGNNFISSEIIWPNLFYLLSDGWMCQLHYSDNEINAHSVCSFWVKVICFVSPICNFSPSAWMVLVLCGGHPSTFWRICNEIEASIRTFWDVLLKFILMQCFRIEKKGEREKNLFFSFSVKESIFHWFTSLCFTVTWLHCCKATMNQILYLVSTGMSYQFQMRSSAGEHADLWF